MTENSFVSEDLALTRYLDTLLVEATESTRQTTSLVDKSLLSDVSLSESEMIDAQVSSGLSRADSSVVSSPVPDWFSDGMQCVDFMVGGHRFSVPMRGLDTIIKDVSNLSHLPSESEFQVGLLNHNEHVIELINFARVALNDDQYRALGDYKSKRHSFALVFCGFKRAIVCDAIVGTGSLRSDDVRWSSVSGWISGTKIEDLSSIVDLDFMSDFEG